MGHNIGPYAYGISHTRMGYPIRVWANIRAYGAEQYNQTVYSITNTDNIVAGVTVPVSTTGYAINDHNLILISIVMNKVRLYKLTLLRSTVNEDKT